jgi:hypothetical protein
MTLSHHQRARRMPLACTLWVTDVLRVRGADTSTGSAAGSTLLPISLLSNGNVAQVGSGRYPGRRAAHLPHTGPCVRVHLPTYSASLLLQPNGPATMRTMAALKITYYSARSSASHRLERVRVLASLHEYE